MKVTERLVCCVFVLACCLLATSVGVVLKGGSPPFQQRWSLKMEGYALQTDPVIPPMTSNNDVLLVWTSQFQGAGSEPSGVSLKDGKLLWTLPGYVVNTSDSQNVTVPFTRVGHLRNGKGVADIFGQWPTFTIQGFVILDLSTGKAILDQGTYPYDDSQTQQITTLDAVYYVRFEIQNTTIFRLAGPDYDPSHPAATFTYKPTNGHIQTSFPNLWEGQRTDVLLHMPLTAGVAEILDPLTLKLLWTSPQMPSPMLTIVEPQEDIFVLSTWSPDPPHFMSMVGYQLAVPPAVMWQWNATWETYAGFSFEGLARSPFGAAPLACGFIRVWNKAQTDSQGNFFCVDSSTQVVSLNFTTSPNNNVVLASFINMFNQWALFFQPATGNLIAIDCFTSDANPLASPDWVLPDQNGLVSLTFSDDLSFVVAYYADPVRVVRWDVIG